MIEMEFFIPNFYGILNNSLWNKIPIDSVQSLFFCDQYIFINQRWVVNDLTYNSAVCAGPDGSLVGMFASVWVKRGYWWDLFPVRVNMGNKDDHQLDCRKLLWSGEVAGVSSFATVVNTDIYYIVYGLLMLMKMILVRTTQCLSERTQAALRREWIHSNFSDCCQLGHNATPLFPSVWDCFYQLPLPYPLFTERFLESNCSVLRFFKGVADLWCTECMWIPAFYSLVVCAWTQRSMADSLARPIINCVVSLQTFHDYTLLEFWKDFPFLKCIYKLLNFLFICSLLQLYVSFILEYNFVWF
jgi:hypothetical protein